jgi:hypothetical protein
MNLSIHPYIRAIILLCILVAVYLSQSIQFDMAFYLFVLIPLLLLHSKIKNHIQFLLVAIFPIFLSFVLIKIIVLNGQKEEWQLILVKTLKLIISATIFQFLLLIPSKELYITFKKWGFKNNTLIILLSSFTVWNEITNRADKIVTARLARGYVKNRNLLSMGKQLTFVLNPLLVGVMRTSIERAESWSQKNISELVNHYKMEKLEYSVLYNLILLIFSIAYLILVIIDRFLV